MTLQPLDVPGIDSLFGIPEELGRDPFGLGPNPSPSPQISAPAPAIAPQQPPAPAFGGLAAQNGMSPEQYFAQEQAGLGNRGLQGQALQQEMGGNAQAVGPFANPLTPSGAVSGSLGVLSLPGEAASSLAEAAGAPPWLQKPIGAVANVLPFTGFSNATKIGTALGAGLGGLYGNEAGQELGVPDIPYVGNPLGLAGSLLGGVAGGPTAEELAPHVRRLATEEEGGARIGGYDNAKVAERRAAQRGALRPEQTDIQRRRAEGQAEARASAFSYNTDRVLEGRDVPGIDSQRLIARADIVPPDDELVAMQSMIQGDKGVETRYQLGRLRAQAEAGQLLDSRPTAQALDAIDAIQSRALAPTNAESRGYLDAMREIHSELANAVDEMANGVREPAGIAPQTDLFGTEVYRSPRGENVPNEQQAGLGISSGERPIETAGPMFAGDEQPPATPPPPPPSGPLFNPQPQPAPEPYVFRKAPGTAGAQAAIDAKQATTLEPGRIFGPEGSLRRKVAGVVNPSVNMPEEVHIANQARTSVRAQLYGEFSRDEGAAAKAVQQAWDRSPAQYAGSPNPAANTLADYLERPSQYTASPELQAAKDGLKEAQMRTLATARGEYGVDIKPYQVADPEGVYVPHVLNTDNLENAVQRTSAGLAGRPGVAKTRAYDTIADRVTNDLVFAKNPELDVPKLMDIHAQALSSAGANETFKLGVGGKTRVEVIDELHPGLRAAKEGAQRELASIEGRLATAEAQQAGSIKNFRATAAQERYIEARQEPLQARVDALGPDYGPELSHLSGQLYELRNRAAIVENAKNAAGGRVVASGEHVGELQTALDSAQQKVTELVKRYQTAGVDSEKYALSPDTYRFHPPQTTASINSVLKTRFDNAAIEAGLNAVDEYRGMLLGPDFSPLTIQGLLGTLSHPMTLITHAGALARSAFSEEALTAGLKSEDIARYEFASGRTYGQVGREFRQEAQGFERVPGVGSKIGAFNEALQRVTERGRIQAFLDDSHLLQKFKGLSEQEADAEANSTLSKIVPLRNPAETGRSVQRARLERAPVISTSFIAGPAELTKDYASGVAKILTGRPGQLSGREALALYRGTIMAGAVAGISTASALVSAPALHEDPKKAVQDVLNPGSSRFSSIVLPNGGSIPLGGPFRSFIRAIAPGIDREGHLRLFAGGDPLHFIDAKLSIHLPLDLYRNQDFQGNKIASGTPFQRAQDIAKYVAENTNLIIGAGLQPMRTGQHDSAGEIGTQLAAQALGGNYREPSNTDQRDVEARARGYSGYNDERLSPDEKKDINAKLDIKSGAVSLAQASNIEAVDNFLSQNKDYGKPPYLSFKGLARNINQDESSVKAWGDSKTLLDNYYNHPGKLVSDAAVGAALAKRGKTATPWEKMTKDQQASFLRSVARDSDPNLDALVVWWGGSQVLQSKAAGDALHALTEKYGTKPPYPGFKERMAKDAK